MACLQLNSDSFSLKHELHLVFNLDGKVAVCPTDGKFARYIEIFIVAEDICQHVPDDGGRVGLAYVAVFGTLENRLILRDSSHEPIQYAF
jgi:hypothetical protein